MYIFSNRKYCATVLVVYSIISDVYFALELNRFLLTKPKLRYCGSA